MDTLLQDLRYSARRLLQSPGFTIAAALTLALGIGANTTIFTLINAILLRPPVAVAEPERLVSVYTSDYSGPPFGTSSVPDFEEFRKLDDVFSGVMVFAPRPVSVGADDERERGGMEIVSDNYFQVLGLRPAFGRFFIAEEGRPGAAPVAVISEALFQRRFGANASVVGTSILLNGRPFTIVGVAPAGFAGAMRPILQEFWVPLQAAPALGDDADILTNRGSRSMFTMARLRPGVTMQQAQSRVDVLARQLATAYPGHWTDLSEKGRRITLVAERDSRIPPQMEKPALGFLALLMATVGLVLLVCCANVASLMLARSAARGREIGIRLSLGATRRRLIRQLLTESLVVAALGGIFGVLLAVWLTSALVAFQPPLPVKLGLDLSIDGRVVIFTALASLATGVLFGLAPALRVTRPDIVSVLKSEGTTINLGGRRLTMQNTLVVSQVAISAILLVAAVLFGRALRSAASIDPGFRVDNLLIAPAGPRPGSEEPISRERVMEETQRRIAALPGVLGVSWTGALPLEQASRGWVTIEGYTPRQGEDMEHYFYVVGPRYFETMEIPLMRGRGFSTADRAGAPGVIVVNEAFARRFWPGADPLGKRISRGGSGGPLLTVIGVTRDGRFRSLASASPPSYFLPALQAPAGTDLVVRTSGDPLKILPAVQAELAAVAPTWTISNARTMEQHIGSSVLPQRVAGTGLAIFGFVALLLVSVGVYGVVAYSVTTRTREIGVRIALGAEPRDARWLVVRQGTTLVAIGVGIALPIAWAVMRLLSSFLIGASPTDPIAFASAAILLGIIALLATYVPARRASLIDPMVALRSE
jgi:putative ABC transport system permease protein